MTMRWAFPWFLLLTLPPAAQQGPGPFGRGSTIRWIDGIDQPNPPPRVQAALAGKKYILIYVKPPGEQVEPAVFANADILTAARGPWAFACVNFSKESAFLKSLGATAAPSVTGCDIHHNVYTRSTDISAPSVRKVLGVVAESALRYETKLKADHEKAIEIARVSPRKAIRPLVDIVEQGKKGYREIQDALEILADIAKEDWKLVDLAQGVGVEKVLEALEEMARVFRATPPGAQAELKIADLEEKRGGLATAVHRLEKVSKLDPRFLRAEVDAAFAALDRIRAETGGRDIGELQKALDRVRAAERVLAERPGDPAAGLELGRYHCFVRADWEQGLPMLAMGADAPLKSLAVQDLAAPADGPGRAKLGDAWWEHSARAGADRDACRIRACHWYDQAVSSLTGLARLAVEKRLEEAGPLRPGVDLLKLVDPKVDALSGTWTIEEGVLVAARSGKRSTLLLPYAPPEEYTLRVVVTSERAGMVGIGAAAAPSRVALILNWPSGNGALSGLSMIDGKQSSANETTHPGIVLPPGRQVTTLVTVRKGAIRVEVDGKAVVDWKGEFSRLATNPIWRIPVGRALFVGCEDTSVRIAHMVLVPLSGQGKRLR